jgi:hypothetical protein
MGFVAFISRQVPSFFVRFGAGSGVAHMFWKVCCLEYTAD